MIKCIDCGHADLEHDDMGCLDTSCRCSWPRRVLKALRRLKEMLT